MGPFVGGAADSETVIVGVGLRPGETDGEEPRPALHAETRMVSVTKPATKSRDGRAEVITPWDAFGRRSVTCLATVALAVRFTVADQLAISNWSR